MFCPNCGAEIREGARFCPECGHKMEDRGGNPAPGSPVPPEGFQAASAGAAGQGTAASSGSGATEGASGKGGGFHRPPKPEPPSYASPANVVHAKSRVTAGLLGVFLGWLGVHKFYLGYTAPGLIMLIGFFILCFFGLGFIMALIGFVEGLIYLTKTDQEFYRLYVAHQKDWF